MDPEACEASASDMVAWRGTDEGWAEGVMRQRGTTDKRVSAARQECGTAISSPVGQRPPRTATVHAYVQHSSARRRGGGWAAVVAALVPSRTRGRRMRAPREPPENAVSRRACDVALRVTRTHTLASTESAGDAVRFYTQAAVACSHAYGVRGVLAARVKRQPRAHVVRQSRQQPEQRHQCWRRGRPSDGCVAPSPRAATRCVCRLPHVSRGNRRASQASSVRTLAVVAPEIVIPKGARRGR